MRQCAGGPSFDLQHKSVLVDLQESRGLFVRGSTLEPGKRSSKSMSFVSARLCIDVWPHNNFTMISTVGGLGGLGGVRTDWQGDI